MKKKIIFDFAINIISNLVLIAIIQLLILPILSRDVTPTVFGEIVSIYGFSNVITTFLGNTLNNIRLITSDKEKPDFFSLSIVTNIAAFILILVLSLIYGRNLSIINIIIFSISTMLTNNRIYSSVFYRKQLKFIGLLYMNLSVVTGYLLGLLLVNQLEVGYWSLIFLSGEIAGHIYLFLSNNQIMYEFKTADLKKVDRKITKKFMNLSFANLIANILNYLDRFMILPILGAVSMSIFYAASSISKIIAMLVTPMTNVLLSYIAKDDYKIKRKKLLMITMYLFIAFVPLYFIVNYVSVFLINILYPNLANQSLPLVPIITIGILFNVLGNIINTFLLKLYKLFYQNIIQISYGLIYIFLAVILSLNYGIIGFSVAYVFAMVLKLLLQISIIVFREQEA
ncbi:oligosaccharide flippase family protein [Enterococcus sp. DIV1298c]|uniref:lipopolysaccharide biosynthesis protein n=1 Tax=Enterococcus sp. DIV1298c TaxID=2815328 RepID=UPI001A926DF7|nr:oligosaccharide flippase family protein [Enterococcus sp. DIV1298c]MBO0462886.1 oligosaccharide flippase family protein [Enterococcus sp. DIV1298c]